MFFGKEIFCLSYPKASGGRCICSVRRRVFLLHRSAPITIFAAITGIVVLVLGAVKMNEAIKARERKKPFLWLFIQSALHIAFGFLLVINPTSGTSLWIVLMGCYLIYLGLTLVITAALSKYELMR